MHVRFTLTLAAGLIVATNPHGTAAAADCSKTAVRQAAAQAGVANPDFPSEVIGGVCGAFLGAGSRAMGVVLRAQQCAQRPDPRPRAFRVFGGALARSMRDDHHARRVLCGGRSFGVRLNAAGGATRCHCARPRATRTLHAARVGRFECDATATTLTCEFVGRGFALTAAGRLRILIPPSVEG